jgi:hypothetical protein
LGLFLVVWVLRRQYRAVLAAGGVAGGLYTLGLLRGGVAQYAEWWSLLRHVHWSALGINLSIAGLVQRLWQADNPQFAPLWLEPRLVWPSTAGLMIAALAFAWSWSRETAEADRDYLVVGLLALLVSPLGWVYYLWLFMPAFCVVIMEWLRARDARSDWAILAVVLFCIPATILEAGQPNGWLTLTLGSAYFWAALLVLVNAAVDTVHMRRIESPLAAG